MTNAQLQELMLQSLEHERGGVQIYKMALQCAVNAQLREEWSKYLTQTEHHVQVLTGACMQLGLDPGMRTPACQVVREKGLSLIRCMEMALANGDGKAAELVACEAVVDAETKDLADWELIGAAAKGAQGAAGKTLQAAYDEVKKDEEEHRYHSEGWCRELWRASLGLEARLPPPEEQKQVKTAVEAARVKQSRTEK